MCEPQYSVTITKKSCRDTEVSTFNLKVCEAKVLKRYQCHRQVRQSLVEPASSILFSTLPVATSQIRSCDISYDNCASAEVPAWCYDNFASVEVPAWCYDNFASTEVPDW